MITITMPGIPVAWARAGRKAGISFTPKKQAGAMADLKLFASRAMAGRKPFEGALSVAMTFQYPWPMSWSAKKRNDPANRWRASRPDADNLMKLVGDGLNGIVWSDDAVIADCTIAKVYGDGAMTQIIVRSPK